MIKISKNDYEIEETIELFKGEESIYKFDLKITDKELLRIKEILFGLASKHELEYKNANLEMKKLLEKQVEEDIKSKDNEFAEICMKEHKDKYLELAGEYKYNETLEELRNYFIDFFIKKGLKPVNMVNSNLMKSMNSIQRFM